MEYNRWRSKQEKEGYFFHGLTKQELFDTRRHDELKFLCMQLAKGDIEKFEKYYNDYYLGDIMEMFTINAVVEYQDQGMK